MRRAVLAVVLACGTAHADSSATVTVTLNAAGQQLADYLHLSVPELIQNAEDKFNALFQTQNLPGLLSAFASTTAIADRGLGVNYAVIPGQLMIGAVANGALSTDKSLGDTNQVVGGFVFNLSAMAGLNFKRWGLPQLTVFANAFYETGSYRALAGHLTTAGLHAQYRVVPGTASGGARWLGLDVTSGIERATWEVGAASNMLPIKFKVNNPQGDSENMTFNAVGTMDVVADATTVPIELTTGIRLGGVLALYAGGGVDFTAATGTITVALDGDMVITLNQENVGTAHIAASGSASPSPVSAHALAGLQLDLPYTQLYVQGLLTSDAQGLAFGLRLAL